ncbi:hypothetical protein BH10PSE1_BH10PSE1_06630 [soil metagenome]
MRGKLNKLERILPEGLLVDSGWMNENGYANSLRAKYVASGRLEQPARRVYRRPRGPLDWPVAVLSLQTQLDYRIVVGGRTALELQGYAHYLPATRREVHLSGDEKPPTWLADLTLDGPSAITRPKSCSPTPNGSASPNRGTTPTRHSSWPTGRRPRRWKRRWVTGSGP